MYVFFFFFLRSVFIDSVSHLVLYTELIYIALWSVIPDNTQITTKGSFVWGCF